MYVSFFTARQMTSCISKTPKTSFVLDCWKIALSRYGKRHKLNLLNSFDFQPSKVKPVSATGHVKFSWPETSIF